MTAEDPKIVKLNFVKDAVAGAEEAPPAEPGRRGGGGDPAGSSILPEDCPVTPLGIEGATCFYLDASRQLRAVPARDHSRLGVQNLFGRQSHRLYDYWPRYSKPDKQGNIFVTGWKPELAAEGLMAAAAAEGVWDPFKRVRGAGAWAGEDGELILHLGDEVLVFSGADPWGTKRTHKPGRIGRNVYPAFEPIPGPATEAAAADGGPGGDLLTLFNTWAWRRGEIDARLLLGWTGCAMIGGALDWRPLAWVTGGKGTGKSTLHRVLAHVFGGALVSVSDTSAAGIWQELGYATLPVTLDEAEASEDNRNVDRVIKLARQAASGGVVLRGGADHNSVKFMARSCFLFSSILVPPLEGADRSRMAILELGELGDQPAPKIDGEKLRTLGAGLRRRLVDGWNRFGATLQRYRVALTDEGMTARGADQFGALLAIADLILHDDETDTDIAAEWAVKIAPVAGAEFDRGEGLDEFLMVDYLMGSAVELPHKAGRVTIGELIAKALHPADGGEEANHTLGTYGLGVMFEKDGIFLAIANRNPELARLFRGTHWAGRASASNVWVQATRRLPGAWQRGTTYFPGNRSRAVMVPIAVFVGQTSEVRDQGLEDADGGNDAGAEL